MKYIDAEKLIKSVNNYQEGAKAALNPTDGYADYYKGKIDACEDMQEFITSHQLEQPELPGYDMALLEVKSKIDELYEKTSIGLSEYDSGRYNGIAETCMKLQGFIKSRISSEHEQQEMDVVSTAKVFLDALSKTPYNNKPITDAQIIVKQLLLFFETPSKYNPDAIVEQPDVDLEKEIDRFWDSCIKHKNEIGGNVIWSNKIEIEVLASHFYELGKNARKED